MPPPHYDINELKSVLIRSDKSTLITEGRTDYTLFRSLSSLIGQVDCLPAGNKHAVLAVNQDHLSYGTSKIACLVDSDLWVIDGVPELYQNRPNLVMTDGYSIENDLLRDINAEDLILQNDLANYHRDLALFCQWFCAGVIARRDGFDFDFNQKASYISQTGSGTLTLSAQADVVKFLPPASLIDQVLRNHQKLLRGKTWLSLLSRYLNYQGRPICHNPMALLELGLKSRGYYSSTLIGNLEAYFL